MRAKIPLSMALLVLTTTAGTSLARREAAWSRDPALQLVRRGEMSAARAAHQATLLGNGDVLITGGCADPGCDDELASVEIYDVETGAFRSAAPMGTPRRDHFAVLLPDGRVLVAGGWTGRGPIASAEVYDPTSDRWSSVGEMLEARTGAAAVRLLGGDVLIMGGRSPTGAALASAEVFRVSTSSFEPAGAMVMPRRRPEAVALGDGRILISGGQGGGGEILRSTEVYDPRIAGFRPTGEMIDARVTHAAVLLRDGRVLVVGGGGARENRQQTTEIYDPVTGRFLAGPRMHWPRRKIRDAVVVLPSGAVVVTGGAARAEIWSPGSSDFLPVPGELEGEHEFATATPLGTGDVLVLGGYDARIRPSASAWVLSPVRSTFRAD